MLIYLLRHGQTEYNAQKRYQGQRDIPLSPEGAAQLRRADFDPDVVYVSTLQRTRDRKSTRLNSSHVRTSRMPSSA